jgi:hypothetical protein
MQRSTLSRRSLLSGLAVGAGMLPFERLALAGSEATVPQRLMIFMQNNGTQQANFWPADSQLRSPILDALFVDPVTQNENGLRQKTNLIKGVYVPYDANGTNSNEHDMGFARMFTGEKLLSIGGQPWGGAVSVDQILAKAWGIDSLTLAVLASQTEPHPHNGYRHRASFSYLGPGIIKQPRLDPLSVFNYLFSANTGSNSHRISVLEAVAGNLSEVSARLGASERQKLDYHLTAIRDVQRRLVAVPSCTAPATPADYLAADPNAEVNTDTHIPGLVDNLIDLAGLALSCGITRIASMQFGYCGGVWRFRWVDPPINMNCHADVAHLDTSDAGSTPENTARLVQMNRYYASRVARLATALDAIPEGSGTMLDNTLIVWANEFGRGDHNQENVPIVLIGKASGALPAGGRLVDRGRQVFNRLGCTLLNLFGVNAAGFGDVPDCGVFQGL